MGLSGGFGRGVEGGAEVAAPVGDPRWWRREGDPKKGFRYVGANGRELKSATTLERIRALARSYAPKDRVASE